MFQLPAPAGLPDVESELAGMLRGLGQVSTPTPLASIPEAEREALMLSLGTTLTRALYHRARFEQALALVAERRILTGGAVFDACAQSLVFEAVGLLAAARTSVDEVLFVAGRRAGLAARDSARLEVSKAIECDLARFTEYDLPEVRLLRARLPWYEDMNVYRNVLVHHGWRDRTGGYFPPGSPQPEARSPRFNTVLIPDRGSTGRAKRAHEWTYAEGRRLEDLVAQVGDGLVEFLTAVATAWGGEVPVPGTMPRELHPNVAVLHPHPALLTAAHIYAPLCTTEALARGIHSACFRGATSLEVFEVLPILIEDGQGGPGFWFCLPTGERLREVVPRELHGRPDADLVLVLDPTVDLATGRVTAWGRELYRESVVSLTSARNGGYHVKVSRQLLPELDRVFLLRASPVGL